MKRLLLVSHSAQLTGMPQVLFNIASNIDASRFEPLVLFPEDGPIIGRFKAAGVPTAIIDIGDSRWRRLHVPMIEAFCLARQINIVHANTLFGSPFVIASKKCGIPCFWYFQEMLGSSIVFDLDEDEFKMAVDQASMIGTASHACKQAFAEYCRVLGLEAPEVAVVHNGVRIPDEVRAHEPGDPVELLSIGNFQPHKGYQFLIEALAIVKSSGKRVSLTILGDGDPRYIVSLWEQTEKAGVEELVRFLTAELDVSKHIQDADIVVNPSVVENFSLAIAEAMAHAKPVVATDVGGTRELLTDGETGLLVPSEDPEALATAIIRFLENPDFARLCGEKARDRIKHDLTEEKQAEQLQTLYSSILSSSRPSRDRESSEMVPEIVDLISEALVSINEKFRALDMHNSAIDYGLDVIPKIMEEKFKEAYGHIEGLDKKIEEGYQKLEAVITDNHKYSSGQLANLEKDVRNLETVVDNLLQQLPFRIMRKIKHIFGR